MHRIKSLALSVTLLATFLIVTGCCDKVDYPEVVTTPSGPTPVVAATTRLYDRTMTVGRSVQGRPITATVLGSGDDVIMILGAIHGNERAGAPLSSQLTAYLRANPDVLQGRKVVLLPVPNPDGYAANTRHNSRGVDLNRNFPAANRVNDPVNGPSGFSEPESKIIGDLMREHGPNRMVAIHQPLDCIDYDGPAGPLANHMGRHCRLPVKKLGARPGSLGSYAGVTHGIPIVTFELPPGLPDADALWQQYGRALVAAVTYPQNAK